MTNNELNDFYLAHMHRVHYFTNDMCEMYPKHANKYTHAAAPHMEYFIRANSTPDIQKAVRTFLDPLSVEPVSSIGTFVRNQKSECWINIALRLHEKYPSILQENSLGVSFGKGHPCPRIEQQGYVCMYTMPWMQALENCFNRG